MKRNEKYQFSRTTHAMQQTAKPTPEANQNEVISFLSDPASYSGTPGTVERIETHGAIVFLAGDDVFKIKKAVKFPYMDFSTLEKRRRICEREFEINRAGAPDIYIDVVAITRTPNGNLAFGGAGEAAEWAVHMKRFDQSMVFDRLAEAGGLSQNILKQLSEVIVAYQKSATVVPTSDGTVKMKALVSQLTTAFNADRQFISQEELGRFKNHARTQLERAKYSLRLRGRRGCVRRCHGDLHLRNIVLLDGKPTLFDAIEFNEDIATIDLLYDLAFLIMDLDQRGLRPQANLVLNRYLHHSGTAADIYGLTALPLFLACRAGIRAIVAMDRAAQLATDDIGPITETIRHYFEMALGYLEPAPARAIAVGGFSGSGKSTVAAALAPHVGSAPGALHLRSDLERKAMFGVAETERLPPESYTQSSSDKVYDLLMQKARVAMKAGHSVVVDAVFSKPGERAAIEQAAARQGVPFAGLWMNAPRETLLERVAGRRGDASDATGAVVEEQLTRGTGPIGWQPIDASGATVDVVATARSHLALSKDGAAVDSDQGRHDHVTLN